MDSLLEKLMRQIDTLALNIVMLDSGDIPGLGEILKSIELIEDLTNESKEEMFSYILEAMKGYVEKLILEEKSDLAPLTAGISQLQEICRNLINFRTLYVPNHPSSHPLPTHPSMIPKFSAIWKCTHDTVLIPQKKHQYECEMASIAVYVPICCRNSKCDNCNL